MSPNILASVRENLKKNSKLDNFRIEMLLNNMKLWKKNKIIYPNMVKSLLRITYLETYTILGLLENQGILENCYEIYCSNCEKFIDYKIIDSIDEFPENLKCENDHTLNPLNDLILLFRVVVDD